MLGFIQISGVHLIECKKMNVDRFVENCATDVLIHCKATWSEGSIRRVLTVSFYSMLGNMVIYRECTFFCIDTCWFAGPQAQRGQWLPEENLLPVPKKRNRHQHYQCLERGMFILES